MQMDLLADALNQIKICDKIGKKECIVRHSKLIENVLEVMKKYGYIKNYLVLKEGNFLKIKVFLSNKIVDCKAIKPRFPFNTKEFLKFEKRYLPARDKGILIVSTNKGVMSHMDAKSLNIGGILLAYVY
ncbi:MAG: 30S ribosomal protein S8 [Candidatus Aenigmarchaeota archaeon]|nr:30S ribosomal protein S8 [Candidatus Aenigmarchaeota archaeon]MDW8149793.1 30S ribosomal protein S8 [Candidatus Aenigmarchaeota archaeon]